jgi:hypothetical protein
LAESPATAVRQILAAWEEPRVGEMIDALGEQLAVQARQADTALDALELDDSIRATTLRAELLVWLARGSMTDALYEQHIESGPMSLREARQVYGQRKLAAIACGHHNYGQGAVFLVNYAKGINERDGMRNVTSGVSGTEGGYGGVKPVPEGGVRDRGGHYMFPYPLSDKSFLASYSCKRPEEYAGQNFSLYYIDVWGNKELIHRDKQMSVAFLSPLRPTPRPPLLEELPSESEGETRWAVASVANVHAGWPDAETARIKYLRISQKVPWPCVRDESKSCGFNDLHWMPAAWDPVLGMWDWGAARVIGMVPVEEDGSAHFKVPADQTVYFQALDENYLELRRMRSNVTFRAGESRGCIGCHETRAVTLPPDRTSLTLTLLHDAEHVAEVKLSREEWLSLVTWGDLNAQYWGTFVEKDGHYASRRAKGPIVPPRRVDVLFPAPWTRPAAGRWFWQDDRTVALQP